MWIFLGVAVVVAGGAAAWLMRGRSAEEPPALTAGAHFRGTGTIVAIGEVHTAPLSNKSCVHWVTTVKVPVPESGDGHEDRARMIRSARALVDQNPLALMPKKDKVPMETHQRYASSVFAIELPQGRLVVDSEDAEVNGPPLVIIPRNLARERALLEEWDLVGVRGSVPPAFSEFVLQPGDRVEVGGVVERVGDELRLAREVTLRLRR